MRSAEGTPGSRPTAAELLASPRGAVLCLQLLDESFPAVAYDLVALAARRSEVVLPAHVAGVVAEVAAEVASWSDPMAVADVMDGVVSGSMGWQEPWDQDRAALLPVVQQMLQTHRCCAAHRPVLGMVGTTSGRGRAPRRLPPRPR